MRLRYLTLASLATVLLLALSGCSLYGSDDSDAEAEPEGKRRPQTQTTNESSPETKRDTTDALENGQVASVRVDLDRETRLQVPNGPQIVLPAGSTSGSGQLVADKPPETPALPTDVVSATGGGWDIHLEGTKLTGTAQLQFPVQPPTTSLPNMWRCC